MFAYEVCRIRFEKYGGDLGPSAGFPRLRIHEYSAARCAPTSDPSLPCFFESLAALGNPNSTHGCIGRAKRARVVSVVITRESLRDQQIGWVMPVFLFADVILCGGSPGPEPSPAIVIEKIAFNQTAKRKHVCRASADPSHARKFGALRDDVTASALDGAGPDEVTLTAEGAIGHTAGVLAEVRELFCDLFTASPAELCGTLGGFIEDARQSVAFETAAPGSEKCTGLVWV